MDRKIQDPKFSDAVSQPQLESSSLSSRSYQSPLSSSALSSQQINPSGYLTINNFDYFDWSNVTRLKIKDCDTEITSDVLDTCEDNIVSIDFIGLNSYMNLKLLLHRCPNLKRITLSNVTLNHYDTDFKRFFLIEVPELTDLTIRGTGKLSKSEMHIIDFFFRRVRFGSLHTIVFDSLGSSSKKGRLSSNSMRSDQTSGSLRSKGVLRNNFTKVSANANSLVNLLVANRGTLKNLVMRRGGIPLFNEKLFESLNEPEPEHMKLQLETFECYFDVVGFERILNAQNHLAVLHCSNNKKQSSFSPSCLDAVMNAIRRCSQTLREVRFCHNVQITSTNINSNNLNNNSGNNIVNDIRDSAQIVKANPTTEFLNEHDCSVYKYCQNLQYLNITCASSSSALDIPHLSQHADDINDVDLRKMRSGMGRKPGAILNTRFLPLSLTHLIVKFDSVTQHGLDLFVHRLPRMMSLKFFVFTGNRMMPYKLKVGFIKTLVDLPEIQIFELNGFIYEDLEAVLNFYNSRPDLARSLEIGDSKCLYWKKGRVGG